MPTWLKLFVNFISSIVWRLPRRCLWLWARCLGFLIYKVFRFRRFTLLRNITIAFPDWDKQKRLETVRQSVDWVCFNLIEFFLIPRLSEKNLAGEVIFEGLEHYHAALAKGKGVLLLSLHLGNGDMGVAFMSLKGLKVNLISKKFSNSAANSFWFGVRERVGAKFIDAHGSKTAFEILSACRRNEAVVFVIDQFMGKPFGIETTFFGKKTGTAYGLALFATKTEAPVVPVYTYRDQDLRTHLVFDPEVVMEKSDNRDLQIANMTQKYTDKVEELVRRLPEQWMWIHRRWKKWE